MCTTICFDNAKDYMIGNNQDVFFNKGFIFTNNREMKKTALIMPPEKPLEWLSRYGSVSFSQCGKEFPSGGMNEEGLVVVQMTLPETIYPQVSEKPGVNQMQVIQYLLDTCENVAQVVAEFDHLRITQASWTIHYMIFDKHGDSVVIEFIKGELVTYRDKALEVKVLANSSYAESLYYLNEGEKEVKDIVDAYKKNSVERFSEGRDLARKFKGYDQVPIDYIFNALETVQMEDITWSLVFDIKNLTVYCSKDFNHIKSFSLGEIDFSRGSTPWMLDVASAITGEAAKGFKAYTREINRELVNSFFKNETMIDAMNICIPDELLEYLIIYPEEC